MINPQHSKPMPALAIRYGIEIGPRRTEKTSHTEAAANNMGDHLTRNMIGRLIVTLFIHDLRDAERWPSAAARDQHSSRAERDYLRSTLSRRQLQGVVRRGGANQTTLRLTKQVAKHAPAARVQRFVGQRQNYFASASVNR
jgi:hypothetical protein